MVHGRGGRRGGQPGGAGPLRRPRTHTPCLGRAPSLTAVDTPGPGCGWRAGEPLVCRALSMPPSGEGDPEGRAGGEMEPAARRGRLRAPGLVRWPPCCPQELLRGGVRVPAEPEAGCRPGCSQTTLPSQGPGAGAAADPGRGRSWPPGRPPPQGPTPALRGPPVLPAASRPAAPPGGPRAPCRSWEQSGLTSLRECPRSTHPP